MASEQKLSESSSSKLWRCKESIETIRINIKKDGIAMSALTLYAGGSMLKFEVYYKGGNVEANQTNQARDRRYQSQQ